MLSQLFYDFQSMLKFKSFMSAFYIIAYSLLFKLLQRQIYLHSHLVSCPVDRSVTHAVSLL